MDSFDWNRIAAACVISCGILFGSWLISKILIPYSPLTSSVYASENQETIDLKTADIDKGKIIALQQCGVCHSFRQGEPDKIGPSLFNIKNKKIASSPNFNYSSSLKIHENEYWTVENLNKWLAKPLAFAPATLMAYGGLSSNKDRADVIAYLNSLTGNNPPSGQK